MVISGVYEEDMESFDEVEISDHMPSALLASWGALVIGGRH